MTVFIINSSEDPAGTNIKNALLENAPWTTQGLFQNTPYYQHTNIPHIYLVTITGRTIRQEHLDQQLKDALHLTPKQMIFITRHRSKMGEPTLTVHPIGNYGTAEFGGQDRTLVPASPRLMMHLLRLVKKHLKTTSLPHQVCYEVTHHGPYLKTPTFFAEVGSTENEWKKPEPARVIAQALLELLNTVQYEEDTTKDIPVLLGIGGGHYAPRFTDIVFEKNAAFGHMIPSYHIDAGNITPEIIQQAIKTTPNLHGIYLHKKALKKSQVTEYKRLFQDINTPLVSSKELPGLM